MKVHFLGFGPCCKLCSTTQRVSSNHVTKPSHRFLRLRSVINRDEEELDARGIRLDRRTHKFPVVAMKWGSGDDRPGRRGTSRMGSPVAEFHSTQPLKVGTTAFVSGVR